MNNVQPEWCLDRPKVPLAGNVDSEVTQTPILEQTAKHSPVNLRALSKSQNWQAGPWLDQTFWQRNRLFPWSLTEKPSPLCIIFWIDWSGWLVFIKSEILIKVGMGWLVSSDKWKAPLDCLFVKIQCRSLIQNYTRISSFFSHCLDWSENQTWPNKKFLWSVIVSGHCPKKYTTGAIESVHINRVSVSMGCLCWGSIIFILSTNFASLCFKLIITYYHTQKQRKMNFKPRIKLNYNTRIKWVEFRENVKAREKENSVRNNEVSILSISP